MLPDTTTADRYWLDDQTAAIRRSLRAAAVNVVAAGRMLAEVRDRLVDSSFREWVAAHFTFSHETAYKLIRVHKAMGAGAESLPIDASALYILADTRTPVRARELAVKVAERGDRVTPALAREIIRGEKERLILATSAEGKTLAKALDGDRADPSPNDMAQDCRLLWNTIRQLHMGASQVVIGHLPDSDDEHGRDPENSRGMVVPTTLTVYPLDGSPPVVHTSADSLEALVVHLSGHEPLRKCIRCNRVRPLYLCFGRKSTAPDGRANVCRDCECSGAKKNSAKKKAVVTRPPLFGDTAAPPPPTPGPSGADKIDIGSATA